MLGGGFCVWRSRYGLDWHETRKDFDSKLWIEYKRPGSNGIIGKGKDEKQNVE